MGQLEDGPVGRWASWKMGQLEDGTGRLLSSSEGKNMQGLHQGLGSFPGIGYTGLLVWRPVHFLRHGSLWWGRCRETFKSGGMGDGAERRGVLSEDDVSKNLGPACGA
jgi:hypothetical protein